MHMINDNADEVDAHGYDVDNDDDNNDIMNDNDDDAPEVAIITMRT